MKRRFFATHWDFRAVWKFGGRPNAKDREFVGKLKIRIDYSGHLSAIRNTSARMTNAVLGSDMDKIAIRELRYMGNYIIRMWNAELRKMSQRNRTVGKKWRIMAKRRNMQNAGNKRERKTW